MSYECLVQVKHRDGLQVFDLDDDLTNDINSTAVNIEKYK